MFKFALLTFIFSLFLISQGNVNCSMVVFVLIHLQTMKKAHNIKCYEPIFLNRKGATFNLYGAFAKGFLRLKV